MAVFLATAPLRCCYVVTPDTTCTAAAAGTCCLCCCFSPLQVIKLISRVIADFANGEISQASSLFDTEVTLEQYLDKSFYKTASLIAASCRSSAVFSKMDDEHKEAMYAYGKHLGLAFQVGEVVVPEPPVQLVCAVAVLHARHATPQMVADCCPPGAVAVDCAAHIVV